MAERPWMTIGSRRSPLALAQTNDVRCALAALHAIPVETIAIETIQTTGDAIIDRSLADAGGKGLFTKELDSALLAGRIDCAVHSAKDLPTFLPEGIAIAGYRPREDVRDAFVSAKAASFSELQEGATFGTASPRRQALALSLRPDLRPVLLRGNVETRLRKVESGEVEATILAFAGLKRLGLQERATRILSVDEFLPAAGQGAVAITVRSDDHATRVSLGALFDASVGFALMTERAFLAALDGSCRTPIAGLASVIADRVEFKGMALEPGGGHRWEIVDGGLPAEAEALGIRAGRALLARLPAGFFERA